MINLVIIILKRINYKVEAEMTNFHSEISFSQQKADKRTHNAQNLFGEKTINAIIAIALFLLGGNRNDIGKFLGWPIGTLFSLLTRFGHNGIMAFIDQRSQIPDTVKPAEIQPPQNYIHLIWGQRQQRILIPPDKNKLMINASNPLQLKTIVLSFVSADLLTVNQASEMLGLTERRVHQLIHALQQEDVSALIDKRQGQQQDYKVTETVKSELIQQFTANIITGRSTASTQIVKQLNEACDCNVSARWVRHYIKILGLNRIEKSLPELIDKLKKNSKPL